MAKLRSVPVKRNNDTLIQARIPSVLAVKVRKIVHLNNLRLTDVFVTYLQNFVDQYERNVK